MIASLCENYHWTLNEAMSVTLPQMILLGHASHINYERMTANSEKKDKHKASDAVIINGKKLSEMNSDELANYYLHNNMEGGFGPVLML
jgi:hypothetical protein